MMKTLPATLFAIVAILPSILLSGETPRRSGPLNRETKREDIRSEVAALMHKFSSSGFTLAEEMKTMEVIQEFTEKHGTKAVPLLLEGTKDKNDRIRCHSLSTISIIIGEFRRRQGLSKEIDMTTFPFPADEKRMVEEIFRGSLKATGDTVPEVRQAAFLMLDVLRAKEAIPAFKEGIKDSDAWVRLFSCMALRHMGFQEYNALEILTGRRFRNPEDYVQFLGIDEYGMGILAEQELMKLGRKSIPVLLRLAYSEREPERRHGVHILTQMKAEEVIPILEASLKEEANDETTRVVQVSSLYALRRVSTPRAVEAALQYGLPSKDAKVRLETAELFFDEGQERILPILTALGRSEDVWMRIRAASILQDHRQKQAIPILIELLSDRHNFRLAKGRLETITGQKFGDIPPVTTKQMKADYINKWKEWWEKNKDTFELPK